MATDKKYYKVDLEISRVNSKHVFGFVNISHIPYKKFELIFAGQITTERFLFDDQKVYNINKTVYKKHKAFFDKEVPFTFDFELFEYQVGLSCGKMIDYKKDYYEDLPGNL